MQELSSTDNTFYYSLWFCGEKITKGAGIQPVEIATILCVEDLTLHGNAYSWDCTFKYRMKYKHQIRSPFSRGLWLSSTFFRRNLTIFIYECITQLFKHALLFIIIIIAIQALGLYNGTIQVALVVKNPPANAGDIRDVGLILGWEAHLEEGMVTHSSILAWETVWTEKSGRLWFLGSQTVEHNRSDLAWHACIQALGYARETVLLSCPGWLLTYGD